MFCAISGEPPQAPIVSTKSGLIYEARLIRKYVDENGKDPITGDDLKEEDLIEVKLNPKTAAPRPPTLSSIPALLSSLQNEYDATMLETFNLKRQYEHVRQELAHALYANDAANRVIARLMFERDQAREALASIQSTLGADVGAAAPSASVDGAGGEDAEMTEGNVAGGASLPAAVVVKIDETRDRLSALRKAKSKRKTVPEGYATANDLEVFSQKSTATSLHSAKPPGVTCLSVSANGKLVLTGGVDKQVHVYDRTSSGSNNKAIINLKGHTKKITHVEFSSNAGAVVCGPEASDIPDPTYAVSASEDNTIRVWKADGKGESSSYTMSGTLKGFAAPISGISVHPCGELLATAFEDGTWTLHDLTSGDEDALLTVPAPSGQSEGDASGGYEYASIQWHPDGQLLAMGTKGGVVHVWDIKTVSKVATFDLLQNVEGERPESIAVNSLDFSENGYSLAVAAKGLSSVQVWDLRKLSLATTISLDSAVVESLVRFDPSASYLGVATTGQLRVYANKTWKELRACEMKNADGLTGLEWDARTGEVLTVGMDRVLRTFGQA